MRNEKDKRWKVEAFLDAEQTREFKTEGGAKRWLEKMEAKLKEANKLADGVIWTNIEIIYLTRWDCPTVRLAAA